MVRTGRVVSVVAGAIAALTVTACGTSDADEAVTAATATQAPAPSVIPTTDAPATTTAVTTTVAPTTTTAPPPTTWRLNEAVYFTSPSGGFQCGIIELPTRTEAGCQGTTTPVPPRPESCVLDWGSGIRVTGSGPGEFLCSGGLVYTSGGTDAALPAGQTVASFGYTCASEPDDIVCTKDDTGHGFRISENSNEVF
ncbi:hypothetical protein ACFYVR_07535 [Rhodococcus sp. NPDC003318]|uniref:hypothetical protein n=1 Tax=Rhodococcus sp. NPDC003318 TaxID=3364503 RepID=UPI00367CBC3C